MIEIELEKLINKGFEEFKAREPYPHIDKKSFEAGAKFGYDLVTKIAYQWLDCYIDNYLFIDAENKAGIKWDNFINDFRKAMKGE